MKTEPCDWLQLAEDLFSKYCLAVSGEKPMTETKVSELANTAIDHAVIFFQEWGRRFDLTQPR